MGQTALPGFSLPDLPDEFSGVISDNDRVFPYQVQYDRDAGEISYVLTDEKRVLITAPQNFSKDSILEFISRNSGKIIKTVIKEKTSREASARIKTVEIRGIRIPCQIQLSTQRKHSLFSLSPDGTLVIHARHDITTEEIGFLIEDNEEILYHLILSAHPLYKRKSEQISLHIGSTEVKVNISYRRRVKQIIIKVHPLLPVQVTAPIDAKFDDVQKFIYKNIPWISDKLQPKTKIIIDSGSSQEIIINGEKVPYLIKCNPRARRIILKVKSDGIVVVSPPHTDPHIIHRFVNEKEDWIREKLACQQRKPIIEKKYDTGESLLYLGSSLPLTVSYGKRFHGEVIQSGIHLMIPDGLSSQQHLNSVKTSYLFLLKQTLFGISHEMVPKWSTRIGVQIPQVKFGNQKTRWGVCTPKGIILNIRLAMAPMELIEYVIVHELCHLVHHNHSKKFWDLVGQMLPDYQNRRDHLKRDGSQYQV